MIDPTAKTAAYQIFKRIPDSILGLRILHVLGVMQGWNKPRDVDLCKVEIARAPGEKVMQTLVVKPQKAIGNVPVVLHLHGGGLASGTPAQDLQLAAGYMRVHDCVFVMPKYRLSGDAPFPSALEDCYRALVWCRDNASKLGGNPDQLFVMGESSGGGLAAALCLLARKRGEVAVAHQFPLYAMLDDREENWTKVNPDELSWSVAKNRLAWNMYLSGIDPDGAQFQMEAAPARATDFSRLPPATGVVGTSDLFHDENLSWFSRLANAGVAIDFLVVDGAYHGTEVIAPKSVPAVKMMSHLHRSFAAAAKGSFACQK